MGNGSDKTNDDIVCRDFDLETDDPNRRVVEVIADLKDTNTYELSPVYSTIGDTITNIFSHPPTSQAQIQITFTYEGYRVTIHQDGTATFVRV